MTFTEWLSNEIHLRGWNQAELADRSGVSRGAISHIFSGTRRPGIEMLQGIARAMQIPTEQVFRAAGVLDDTAEQLAPPVNPPTLGEWIHMFLDSDEQTRDVMLENARFFAQRKTRKKNA